VRVTRRQVDEIKRCASDFKYFSKKYLKIVNVDGRLIPLKLKPAQERYLETVEKNPWVYVLKARKLGLTTVIAAHNFWKFLFTPNYRVMVVAHTDETAKNILGIYKCFYDSLPAYMRFPIERVNLHEIMLEHGGYIRAGTSSSESSRSFTFQSIHCSEFALWPNIEKTIAAVLSTGGENVQVSLETTANGLNEGHRIWYGENGFEKLFISWTDDPECSRRAKPDGDIPQEIEDLRKRFDLSKHQVNWAANTLATKSASNWNLFMQEYPLEAQMAFITSGKRFFTTHIFPHAKAHEGYRQYEKPKKFAVYTIGVDTASGSDEGDYSAFCTIDCTNKKSPRIVSTFYAHVPPSEFAEQVMVEAKKYGALVVPESNSYGLSIIEYLMTHEFADMYRRTKYDKARKRWNELLGFNTNASTRSVLLGRILQYVSRGWLPIIDERLKAEVNAFVFNARGRPEADTGKHDDMIFATALALIGMDQVEYMRAEKEDTKPHNLAEMLQFEAATGKLYKNQASGKPGTKASLKALYH
tara:strand:- start:32697 stop:34277 length:1581 start_codon:yes stop_codon:yes gene_type:complete